MRTCICTRSELGFCSYKLTMTSYAFKRVKIAGASASFLRKRWQLNASWLKLPSHLEDLSMHSSASRKGSNLKRGLMRSMRGHQMSSAFKV